MEIQGMSWYIGYIAVYFIFLFSVGIFYFFRVKSADDYLIGNWNMGFWPILGTVISTWCGASVFVGIVALSYVYGMSTYIRYSFGALVFTLLLIFFFAKRLRKQKLYTLGDLFGQRYGAKIGIIPSVLSTFLYAIPVTAIQFIALNTLWIYVFRLEPNMGLALSAVIILSFTILGGLPSTIMTDALQSVLIMAGIVVFTGATLYYTGGFTEVIENTDPLLLSFAGPLGYKEVFLFFISVGPFYLVWQSSWQRLFAARTEKIAFRANMIGVMIVSALTFGPIIVGLCARYILPAGTSEDYIFTIITLQFLPPYLAGFIYCAFLAALVTGANSFILQGSSSLTYDFYKRIINPRANNAQLMLVSRISVIIIAVVSLWVANTYDGVMAIYLWALRTTAATIVIPFLATMFWRDTTRIGIILSMLFGFFASLAYPYLGWSIDQTIFGFAFSFIGLLFSLVTEHHPEENVVAVMYEDLPSANEHHTEEYFS